MGTSGAVSAALGGILDDLGRLFDGMKVFQMEGEAWLGCVQEVVGGRSGR